MPGDPQSVQLRNGTTIPNLASPWDFIPPNVVSDLCCLMLSSNVHTLSQWQNVHTLSPVLGGINSTGITELLGTANVNCVLPVCYTTDTFITLFSSVFYIEKYLTNKTNVCTKCILFSSSETTTNKTKRYNVKYLPKGQKHLRNEWEKSKKELKLKTNQQKKCTGRTPHTFKTFKYNSLSHKQPRPVYDCNSSTSWYTSRRAWQTN